MVFLKHNFHMIDESICTATAKLQQRTYREVHIIELTDEGFHPEFILFVDWFVHLIK